VVGTGVATFSLWGRLMRNIRVLVMRTLPSGILIGRRLMLRLKMSLDFSSGVGTFSADTPRGPRIFSGRILHDSSGALEQVEVIWRMRFASWTCRSLATRRNRRLFPRCCCATGCYALLRMRPLLNSWAECSVVISCGKIDYDKSG
jgi:hypothetical protein